MQLKGSLLVGAAVATVVAGSLGATGLVSADTSNTSEGSSSIVDKIATKFKLNKSDVQAVFDEDRQARHAQMEADQKQKLADAVKDGKLTQAQADHITTSLNEIKSLRGTTDPKQESDAVRTQIRAKMDELRTWAESNNIDMQYVMIGHGGHGHGFGPMGSKSTSSDSMMSN